MQMIGLGLNQLYSLFQPIRDQNATTLYGDVITAFLVKPKHVKLLWICLQNFRFAVKQIVQQIETMKYGLKIRISPVVHARFVWDVRERRSNETEIKQFRRRSAEN